MWVNRKYYNDVTNTDMSLAGYNVEYQAKRTLLKVEGKGQKVERIKARKKGRTIDDDRSFPSR